MSDTQFSPMLLKIIKAGMYISGIAIMMMMILTVFDVALKTIFNSTIPGGYLYVQNYLMPLAFFCGLPYAFFSGIFPRLDIVVKRFRKELITKIVISVLAIELISYVLIAYYSLLYGIHGMTTNITFLAGVDSVPLYPFFFLVTIGFGMLSFYLIVVLQKMVKTKGEYTFFRESEELE